MGQRPRSRLAFVPVLLFGLLVAVAVEAQDEMFVANFNDSIVVHSRTAAGNTPPLRTIAAERPD